MIHLLLGDHYLVGEARRSLRARSGLQPSDIATLSAQEIASDSLLGVETRLNQTAMFGPPPWVETTEIAQLLTEISREDDLGRLGRNRLSRLLQDPPEGTWILTQEVHLPRRGPFRTQTAFLKAVGSTSTFLSDASFSLQRFDLPKNRRGQPDYPSFFGEELKKHGLSFDPSFLQQGVERLGSDTASLVQGAKTLSLLVWPQKTLSTTHLSSLPQSGAGTVFRLVDFILDGAPRESHLLLNKLRKGGSEPMMVLGWIVAEWRRLALALDPLDAGGLRDALGPRMGWKGTHLKKRARHAGLDSIRDGFSYLAKTDLSLKTTDSDPWGLLSTLLYNLTP
ncbi:hypothetical protein H8D30_02545 [bacterium]|nr:hypothetical protein [bacterium]